MRALQVVGSCNHTEEALRALGEYLGMESTRPEEEYGTGPDVLWTPCVGVAMSVEVKAEKTEGNVYRTRDSGPLRDHSQWVQNHTIG